MTIKQKRIRKPENYLTQFAPNSNFYVALPSLNEFEHKLISVGFPQGLQVGTSILPEPKGRVSRFNAEGGYRILRDKPKETVYREIWWEWEDYNGKQYADVRYVPYERYQREPIPAPSEELTIVAREDSKLIISRKLTNAPSNYSSIKHVINLFLELFGECEVLTDDLMPIHKFSVNRLNWDVLPKGRYPWNRLRSELSPLLRRATEHKQRILAHRLEVVASYDPDFVAVGRAGFSGYLVFGFSQLDIYILESMYLGNATYVLGDTWETLSQLTKAELLNNELHLDRLIHREGWTQALRKQFNRESVAV